MGKARHAAGRDLKKRELWSLHVRAVQTTVQTTLAIIPTPQPHVQEDPFSDHPAQDKGSPPPSPGRISFLQGKEARKAEEAFPANGQSCPRVRGWDPTALSPG